MRTWLTGMSALCLLCGCLGRFNSDLLQARIREQQERMTEVEHQATLARAELRRTRQEADRLRAELARTSSASPTIESTELLERVAEVQINSLLSGGVDKDDTPGDEACIVQLAPVDADGEVLKLPGAVELTLLDPALSDSHREIGRWEFDIDECRDCWTRGFTGSGYQFTLPLSETAEDDKLVLHAKYVLSDGRTFKATQTVRVTPSTTMTAGHSRVGKPELPAERPEELDDINDPPPLPVGATFGKPVPKGEPLFDKIDDWELPNPDIVPSPNQPSPRSTSDDQPLSGSRTPFSPRDRKGATRETRGIRDSTNWTREALPQLR